MRCKRDHILRDTLIVPCTYTMNGEQSTSRDGGAEQGDRGDENTRHVPHLQSRHFINRTVFFTQVALIYGVVIAAIINLALDPRGKNHDLWSALLFSCLGYLLPSPHLKAVKPSRALPPDI